MKATQFVRAHRRAWKGFWLSALLLTAITGCADPATTRAKYTSRGSELLESGEFEKARVEFLNAVRIDPNDAEARYGAGQAFEKLGGMQQAVGHYLAAVEANPGHVQSHLALARLLALARQPDRAKEHVDKVLALEPENLDALALRATVLVLEDSREEARALLEEVVSKAPANEVAVPLLASLLMNEDQADRASEVVSRALVAEPNSAGLHAVYAQLLSMRGDDAGYLAQLKKLTELEPTVQQHYSNLARGLASAGRVEEATALLRERAIDSASRDTYLSFLVANGDTQEAEREFARFLAEDPDDDDTRFALGVFFEGTGRAVDAETTYRELAERAATDRMKQQATVALARVLVRRSASAEAKALIAKVREDHPSNQQAILLAGQLAMAEGDLDAAIADFRLALRDDPQNLDLHRLLAAAYGANGQEELAREALERAVAIDAGDLGVKTALVQVRMAQGDEAGAEAVVDEMLLRDPRNLFALEQKYKMRLRQKRVEEAIDVAGEIANLYPRSGIGPFYAGAALQAMGDQDRAVERYLEALARQPSAAEPLSMLVRTYLADGKVQEARELLAAQAKLVDEPVLVHKFQGDLEASQGNADAAAAIYEKVIDAQPKFSLAYSALAKLEIGRERIEDAIRALRRGVDATDDARLHVELGVTLQGAGRVDEAIDVYRSAAATHARDANIANNLAMLLAEYRPTPENLDEALDLARRFERSDNAAYLDTLGWVLLKRGDVDGAKRVLVRAVDSAPESALLRYHLAKVLVEAGEGTAALPHLETAIESGQRFSGIEDARLLRERLARSS